MLKYVAIILVEIIFWWRLRQDFPDKSVRSWKYVRFIKILLTILLLYAFGMLLFMKGDIALPMNAFTEIFFGAVAAMTIAAGGFYMLFSLVRLALVKIFKKELNWLRWTTL